MAPPIAPPIAPAAPTLVPGAPTIAPAAPRVAPAPAIAAAPAEAAAPTTEAAPHNAADRPRNEGRPEGRGDRRGPRGRRDEGRDRSGPPRGEESRERSAAPRHDEPRERSTAPRHDEPRERSATPRVDELRERSALRGEEIRERSATPRLDESRERGRRREPRRINEDHVPVSAADGTLEGVTRASAPQRHAEFITWQPAAEEGDDDPILGDEARETRSRAPSPPFVTSLHAASSPGGSPAPIAPAPRPERPESKSGGSNDAVTEALPDGDFGEIYVNVGRREGARAADFLRLLTERAGIDKLSVRRIRVRERNAFVSVRKDDVAKAVAALTGATIAGKIAAAELARERDDDAAMLDAPTQPMRAVPAAPVVREPATEADLSTQAPQATIAASDPTPQASPSDADAEPSCLRREARRLEGSASPPRGAGPSSGRAPGAERPTAEGRAPGSDLSSHFCARS